MNSEGTPNQGRTYDISPDDRRFLRIKTPAAQSTAGAAGRDQLIVVQNWFEELKRLAPAK